MKICSRSSSSLPRPKDDFNIKKDSRQMNEEIEDPE